MSSRAPAQSWGSRLFAERLDSWQPSVGEHRHAPDVGHQGGAALASRRRGSCIAYSGRSGAV